MNVPVDVMGRLAAMAGVYEGWAEVHGAVAELIQAAENVEAWITDYVPGDACGREVELRELSAALARVKGGAE